MQGNAGKYLTAHSVTIMGGFHAYLGRSDSGWDTFRWFWLAFSVLGAVYTYLWDVIMDWGLLSGQGDHRLLRSKRSYPVAWYYFAMVTNLFLRFTWTLTILPFSSNPFLASTEFYDLYVVPVLVSLELYRRAQWGVFRTENAQFHDQEFEQTLSVPIWFEDDSNRLLALRQNERRADGNPRPSSILLEIGVMVVLFMLVAMLLAVA